MRPLFEIYNSPIWIQFNCLYLKVLKSENTRCLVGCGFLAAINSTWLLDLNGDGAGKISLQYGQTLNLFFINDILLVKLISFLSPWLKRARGQVGLLIFKLEAVCCRTYQPAY